MKQQEIISKDNEKIKFLRKLQQKKYRNQYNKFFVENLNIIYDALKSGVDFDSLFVTEQFIKKNKKDFDFILEISKITEYYVISEQINKSFSDLDTPSGICVVYQKQEGKLDFDQSVAYLNGIQDPGNLGTILRSALAFDFKNIVIDENCVDLYNSKTISAAKDSIFKLNIAFDKDLEILKKIKKKMKVYTTSLKVNQDINILKTEKQFCIVLGNEARGVDEKIKKLSDGLVKIKMSEEIESLNVASSATIIFYETYIFLNSMFVE